MATERNPFDQIPMGELSIEIESSTGVDEDGNEAFMEVDPEDGGIVVEFKPPEDERSKVQQNEEPEEFYRNLADDMDEELLEDIAYKVIENFEADKDSRAEWESMFERGFDLLGLKLEEASEPFVQQYIQSLLSQPLSFNLKQHKNYFLLPVLLNLRLLVM